VPIDGYPPSQPRKKQPGNQPKGGTFSKAVEGVPLRQPLGRQSRLPGYEHEGVKYKRKSFSIKGDGLAELLEIPSKEEGERKAVELATRKWRASTPASESPPAVISEGIAPVSLSKRERTEPQRLDKEQSPIHEAPSRKRAKQLARGTKPNSTRAKDTAHEICFAAQAVVQLAHGKSWASIS
jgi:hypothetical protein